MFEAATLGLFVYAFDYFIVYKFCSVITGNPRFDETPDTLDFLSFLILYRWDYNFCCNCLLCLTVCVNPCVFSSFLIVFDYSLFPYSLGTIFQGFLTYPPILFVRYGARTNASSSAIFSCCWIKLSSYYFASFD